MTVLLSFNCAAQLTTIEGNVSNTSGVPVTVTTMVNDFLGNPQYFTATTDSMGDYTMSSVDLDSFLQMVSPTLSVYIVDCNADTSLQAFSNFSPAGTVLQADFDYCPSISNPCSNVAAAFTYTQVNPATQNFIPNFAYIINNSIGSNLSYTWDFGDGTTGVGANVNHTYVGNGPYALCLTIDDNAGCVDTFCDTLTVGSNGQIMKMEPGFSIQIGEGNLSTEELIGQINLDIYPNPVKDQLIISIDAEVLTNARFILTDLSGREILSNVLVNKISQIDLSNTAKGTYILNVQNEGNMHSEKIIVQ